VIAGFPTPKKENLPVFLYRPDRSTKVIILALSLLISVSEIFFFIPRRITSSQRRHLLANRILLAGIIVMRPYSYCTSLGLLYIISDDSEYCAECVRIYR
jgi:hypothetical protein